MRIVCMFGVLLLGPMTAWCTDLPAARWELVDTGTGITHFVAVALDAARPNHMVAAGEHYLLESQDAGQHWQERFRTPGRATITRIALSPHSPSVLIGTDQGLHASTGDPAEFQPVGEKDLAYTDLLFHPTNPRVVFAGSSNGLLASQDGGLTWSRMDIPQQARHVLDIAIDPDDLTRLYVVTNGGLFAGHPAEGDWEQLQGASRAEGSEVEEPVVVEPSETAEETGLLHRLSAIAIDPGPPATLYLAGGRGIQRSADGGRTWEPLTRIGMSSRAVNQLLLQRRSPLAVYAATMRGIARLDSTSNRWHSLTAGLTTRRINDLAGSSQTLWAATDAGLYRFSVPGDSFDSSEAPNAQELLANFSHEPSIGQVREAAIRYAEVHPDKIQRWRRQAALKALLPSVDIGYDRNRSNDVGVDEGTFPNYQFIQTEDRDSNWDLSVSWDLADLIWNQDQTSIDVRSKLMVELRDDILDEVTRTYFERRKLQVALLMDPPNTQKTLAEKELRVQELTALLDALTGSYFSQHNHVSAQQ